MTPRPLCRVAVDALRDLNLRFLVAGGLPAEVAPEVAEVFLESDLRGVPAQGLHHLVNVEMPLLRAGKIDPGGKPEVVREGPASALVDGHRGPGQPASLFAADLAVEKARGAGSAVVGIVNGSDYFMAGYYVERMARAGCVGFTCSDSGPLVHPTGGVGRVFGTNPLALAIPMAGDHPLVLDIATSAWSAGQVRHAYYHREEMPLGIGIGPDGRPTRDAALVWTEGAMSPLGGHKGTGLGLFVAILAAALMGAQSGQALDGWLPYSDASPGTKGHLFLAIDGGAFGDAGAFRRAVTAHADDIKGSRPAPGVDEIRLPGARAFRERERNLGAGTIPIDREIWAQAAELATRLGLAMPETLPQGSA